MSAPLNAAPRRAPDPRAVAADSWGQVPDWVAALAAEVERTTGVKAAARIGYSPSVVSSVLRRAYAGDMVKVEEKVRGALMGATVECPVLGEIGRDRCLGEQDMPRVATSAVRMRLWRACREGCPHSRIRGADDGAV